MNIAVIILDLVLAIPLFFLINYFDSDKEKDTVEINITHILFPIVYIIILAALWSTWNWNSLIENIFLIPVFECIYRTIYVNRVLNRDSLINHKYYYFINGVTILLSYLVYENFISKVENVLPNPADFRGEIWFLIIIFLYIIFKDRIHVNFLKETTTLLERKKEYVVMNYAKLKNQYGAIIQKKSSIELRVLVYAIMVYENFQTPPVMRTIQEYINRFRNKEMKCGIMQVKTKKFISDEESIELAIKKLEQINKKIKNNSKKPSLDKVYKEILKQYNNDDNYINNVMIILKMIIEFDK